jgi:hypothetical protein
VIYDDNIYTRSHAEVEDLIWNITPGLTLGAGDYQEFQNNVLLLSYAPGINFFTHNSRENSVDHDARIAGQYRGGPWTLGLQQTYQQRHDAVADAGTRLDREFWITTGFARYEVSPKTLVDVTATAAFNTYERPMPASDLCYREYTVGVGMDYAVTPKIRVGPAVRVGWIDQKDERDQNYQQLMARAHYVATEKVNFRGAAGVELRNFQGPNAEDSDLNPVLEIGLSYMPLEQTVLTLDAYRREQPSVSIGSENYSSIGAIAGVRQAFLDYYAFTLRGGYETLDYENRSVGMDSGREDGYFFVRPGFEWQPWERLTASIWYLYRQNHSNVPADAFDYSNNQFGLSFAYRF